MSGDWLREVAGIDPDANVTSAVVPAAPDASTLVALAESVEAADDKASAVAAVVAWLSNDVHHHAVAAASRATPGPVKALVARIGARRGLKQHADQIAAVLRTLEKQQAAQAKAERRAASNQAPTADPRDLREILDRPGLPPGLRCPPGWEIAADGLSQLTADGDGDLKATPVTARPLLVTARFRDLGEGTTSLRLEWPTARGWRHRVVPRAVAMEARTLVSLSGWDAPVHSDNARQVVRFLSDFEEHNALALPQAEVSSHMGWQARRTDTFLWGRALLRAGTDPTPKAVEDLDPNDLREGDVYLLADPGAAELADGFRAAGAWDGWLAVAELARPYPVVWLALYAALVPPLMPLLPTLPNFIVDLAGETSMGKTTTLRFAGSAWGCPDERAGGILRTWDSTRVWIERAAGVLGNLPLILDDTKRARRPEDVGRTLYDLASGSGRGRGSVGGLRDTGRWRTVLLSTGEAPATSFTQDGGTRARTLGLWGSPFSGADASTVAHVQGITAGVLRHHGHLGPLLVRWLVEAPAASERVREWYADAVSAWTEAAQGHPVATRAAQYVGALEVVGRLVHDVLGVPRPHGDPLDAAWSAVCTASGDADRASDALREVLSWAASQQARFWGQPSIAGSGDDPPQGGWLGTWQSGEHWTQLAILPTELRGFLARQGFDHDAVLHTWADRGWLRTEGRHRTRKVTVDGRKARCVVLTRAACDAVQEGADA